MPMMADEPKDDFKQNATQAIQRPVFDPFCIGPLRRLVDKDLKGLEEANGVPFVAAIFESDADAMSCRAALDLEFGNASFLQKGNFILCAAYAVLPVGVIAFRNGIECAPLDVEGTGLPAEADGPLPPDDALVEIESSDAVAGTEWQGMRIEDPETGAPCPAFAQRISSILNDRGIPCVAAGGDVAFPRDAEAEVISATESGLDVAVVLDGFEAGPAQDGSSGGEVSAELAPQEDNQT